MLTGDNHFRYGLVLMSKTARQAAQRVQYMGAGAKRLGEVKRQESWDRERLGGCWQWTHCPRFFAFEWRGSIADMCSSIQVPIQGETSASTLLKLFELKSGAGYSLADQSCY